MTSLFASQFNYGSPYGLGPLNTGQPEVGAKLPQKKPKEKTNVSVPSRVPAGSGAGAASSAAAIAAANAGVNERSTSASVGAGQTAIAAQQGTLNKLMHMSEPNAAPATAPASTPARQVPTPGPNSAPAAQGRVSPAAEPHASGGGGFSGFLHHAGNFLNEYYNPVYEAMHPGQTISNAENLLSNIFPKPVGMNSTSGVRQTTDTGVTEPSNVLNPDGSSAYTGRGSIGGAGMRELPASPYSPQFKGFNYQNASGRAPYSPSGQQQANEGGFSNEIENYLRDFNFSDL